MFKKKPYTNRLSLFVCYIHHSYLCCTLVHQSQHLSFMKTYLNDEKQSTSDPVQLTETQSFLLFILFPDYFNISVPPTALSQFYWPISHVLSCKSKLQNYQNITGKQKCPCLFTSQGNHICTITSNKNTQKPSYISSYFCFYSRERKSLTLREFFT